MKVLVSLLALCIYCVECHHNVRTDRWKEISNVLHDLNYNKTDPHDMIKSVLHQMRGVERYRDLWEKKCHNNKRLPIAKDLDEFIKEDQFVQSFISNVTCGHGVLVHNFEYLTTLSLSMAVHLDKFVCQRLKESYECLNPGIIDEHIHRQINSNQNNRDKRTEDIRDHVTTILNGETFFLWPHFQFINYIKQNDIVDTTVQPPHQSLEDTTIKPSHQHKCPRVYVPRSWQRPFLQQFMKLQRILHGVSSNIVSAIFRDLKQMMSDIIKGYKIDKIKEHNRKTKRSSHNSNEHFGQHSGQEMNHFSGHDYNSKYRTNRPSSFNDLVDTDSTGSVLNFSKILTTKDMMQLVERKFEHRMTNRITREQFLDICPSVVYSLLQRSEIKDKAEKIKYHVPPSSLEIYGLGTASVLVISLASLVGAVFVKLSQKVIKDYIMGMLLSLSVGCLVGDAILHLLSEVLVGESNMEKARISETLTKQCALLANKSALAWMVIVGDAIHNFADGLAIGAAFSKDITVGLSTSIAVFCHELPHELGDFAALVSSGLSIKKAMVLNFISSLTAFLGLYIGILASSNDVARSWIFSAGAGMFIYVALANLVSSTPFA
ncbi:Zinc transporter ZIP14,Zinc transporter ZIP12,Zinc transporter ZIP4,Zinc transporter ZIP10,Zinc transporter foi,Zinc transporter ZIP6 [Mytilus coruscus]|uniref:Zinc transporter ZIP14,Zinc transporter ZIP12,Zinc transporter ZIP4,Zinc transporter ZIP10,Zinc transporter foi,Zinc transporter ZIP6 n=1 Tax=Mytilus coruscus TaxID=42192 RepID=A0A6J8ADN1_MYTCO|nr:Zinc transporter ZIP14,Zinc transporter ZIP12,Zinc transporter ZIP4,Zinc transporter ZIP10,Zinc transporter foi,Zinc transporter ZIP6 [Mytilus coruscus]